MRVDVSGQQGLRHLAGALNKAATVDLSRELDKGLRDAGDAVGHGIRDATDIYMPRGYEETFSKSLVIKTQLHRGAARKVTLTGRAFGRKGHDRQVEELERGRLKHRFWGRWVHTPKAWQRIRPHWFTEPAKYAVPAAVRELDKAMRRLADKIGRA